MKQLYLLITVIGILWGAAGCNVINPAETVPTYVHIDSFIFSGTPGVKTGSASHKITNVLVYFNNQPVGNFDLPVTFPVILKERGVLQVLPGIDFDGLSGYEVAYPFYQSDTETISPAPGQVIQLHPATRYTAKAELLLNEDFSNGIHSLSKVSGDTGFVATHADSLVFEDGWSGILKLESPQDSAVNYTAKQFLLSPTQESYIELNYKSTIPFQVGLMAKVQGVDYTEYLIGLSPRATWGKIYIGTQAFASAHQGTEYHVMLRTVLPAGQAAGTVQLDNVKVFSY